MDITSYKKVWMLCCIAIAIMGCKDEYPLPPALTDKNHLVVEGFIDAGYDTTRIMLSRTSSTEGWWENMPESGARVWVENQNGDISPLYEEAPGTYKGGPFVLDENNRYRLQIETAGGKSYTSSFEEVKQTPDIDSVNWVREDDGVHIYVNTHDPSNESRYYAWDFQETWEFFSAYMSSFEYVDGRMLPRMDAEKMYRCWQQYTSSAILIGSSAKLSEDIIYRAPLTMIENNSWKLSSRYSIYVKQRVLSKNAYAYLEKMKKSTESMGTIFDPMPTTDQGNIVCNTDPAEIVIGYVYVSNVRDRRIFISRGEVTNWRFNMSCTIDTIENNAEDIYAAFAHGSMIPISSLGSFTTTHYTASSSYCMDCTLRGTNVKPDFWP